jgi:hypothetical protein
MSLINYTEFDIRINFNNSQLSSPQYNFFSKVKLSLCSTNLSTTPLRRKGEWMYKSTFS